MGVDVPDHLVVIVIVIVIVAGDHLVVLLPLRPERFHPRPSVSGDLVFHFTQASNETLDVAIS